MATIKELESQLATARQRVSESERARDRLADLPTADDAAEEQKALREARDELAHAGSELDGIRESVQHGEQEKAKAADTTQKAKDAASAHAEVEAYESLAAAFAPDGIPGDLLAEALDPINDRLAQHAVATGWPTVRIDADMAIAANGRQYRLLSESEQWRVDAMVAEALSHISGLRLLVLDRMDVLDLPSRGAALKWLKKLAADGEQDTIIVMATLKADPGKALGDDVGVFWLERSKRTAAAA